MTPAAHFLDPQDLDRILRSRAEHPGPFSSLPPASERGLKVVLDPSAEVRSQDEGDETPRVGADDAPPEIWMYGDIGGWFGIYAQDVRFALDQLGGASSLKLRIHSRGGSVFEGAAIYTLFQQCGKRVDVQIDGVALSDAANIAMVGRSVAISPRGFIMIHEAWCCACGPAAEFDKVARLLRKINPSVAALYERRLGQSREQVLGLMDDETWWNAEEAVAAGVADSILEAAPDPETLPDLDDDGSVANRAPREARALYFRDAVTAAQPAPPSLAAEVAAYLESSTAAPVPPGRIPSDTVRAVEEALGRI